MKIKDITIKESWPTFFRALDMLRKAKKFKHLPDDKLEKMAHEVAKKWDSGVKTAPKKTQHKVQDLTKQYKQDKQQMGDEEFFNYYGFSRPKTKVTEKWSKKYKDSINCSNPKGFSQRAHCDGKKKTNEDVDLNTQRGRLEYYINEPIEEGMALHLGKLPEYFDGTDPLADMVPDRVGKFALHPDNWEATFYSLTNKDLKKIKSYKPQLVKIPTNSVVGDMAIANKFYRTKDQDEKRALAVAYKDSMVPYGADISHIKMPEIIMPQSVNEDWNPTEYDFGYEQGYKNEPYNNPNKEGTQQHKDFKKGYGNGQMQFTYDNIVKKDKLVAKESVGMQILQQLEETIRKNGSKWTIYSKRGRKLGSYDTKKSAKKRLKQIEYFKHMKEDYDADLPVVMSLIIEALDNDNNWNLDGDVNWDYVASDVWIAFEYKEMGYDDEEFNDLYMDAAERVAERFGTNPPYHGGLAMENFADGKKPGRKGLAKRMGVDCSKSVTALRKIAKNSSGEKQRMAHWCANMKSGRKKK